MKILRYGAGYPKICTCDDCQSELEYTDTDIQHTTATEYPNDSLVEMQVIRIEYIVCPVCGKAVRIFSAPIWSCSKESKKRWWQR